MLFSLKGISRAASNRVGEWSGLTPDAFPLFTRDTSIQEIYALDVELPQRWKTVITLWKDADPDIPIFVAAKAEYAKLH